MSHCPSFSEVLVSWQDPLLSSMQGWISSGRSFFLPDTWKKLEEINFFHFFQEEMEESGRNGNLLFIPHFFHEQRQRANFKNAVHTYGYSECIVLKLFRLARVTFNY